MNVIARTITEKRKALHMTQRELADVLNVSDKTVSRWETGNQIPDALTMPLIAKALGITLMELYGEEQVEESAGYEEIEPFDYVPVTRLKVMITIGLLLTSLAGVFRYFGYNYLVGSVLLISGTAVIFIGLIVYRDFYQKKYRAKAYLLEEMNLFGLAMAALGTIISLWIPLCNLFSWMHILEMSFVYFLDFVMAGIFSVYHKKLNDMMPCEDKKQTPFVSIAIGLIGLLVFLIFVYNDIQSGDIYWGWVDIPPLSGMLYSLCFLVMLWMNYLCLRKRIKNGGLSD